MSVIAITLVPPTLPNGYCPDGPNAYQQFANDLIDGTTATVAAGNTGYNYGNNIPGTSDQNKPWLRLFGDGTPDRWYVYSSGVWIAKHQSPASGSERRMWVGIEADLVNYDGGAAGSITATTGAMWAVDHAFDFRMPLGAGTSPAPLSTVIAPTNTGGEEKHTNLLTEIPNHAHVLNHYPVNVGTGTLDIAMPYGSPGGFFGGALTSALGGNPAGSPANSTDPHNNMPPYYGVFFIKRTARIFYTPS